MAQPRLCPECGTLMPVHVHVHWHGDAYDFNCVNLGCALLYYGPPYTEAELAYDGELVLGPPNCPRCLVQMNVVCDGDEWRFACHQDGCDGSWPPSAPDRPARPLVEEPAPPAGRGAGTLCAGVSRPLHGAYSLAFVDLVAVAWRRAQSACAFLDQQAGADRSSTGGSPCG